MKIFAFLVTYKQTIIANWMFERKTDHSKKLNSYPFFETF